VRRVSFTSFPGLRVKALLSLPEDSGGARRLPALLVADHRRGIPVWGNEQPLELNQWGDRAVLIVETIDRGSRVLERNLRSFSDDDAVHHMKRQAMVMGTTIESMQVYEILRSIELLRGLAFVDPQAITLAGRYDMAVNALYASLLDGSVARVVMTSPTGSHRYGPHYLGVLRYTDVRQVAELEASRVRLHGERPPELAKLAACDSLPDCLR
jgi:cephalosporin-C deacetylase-like acetyl esterase